MTKWLVIFLVPMVVLAGCNNKSAGALDVGIYNIDLAAQYRDYDGTWRNKRSAIVFENNESADDCASYVRLSKSGRLKKGVNNQLIQYSFIQFLELDQNICQQIVRWNKEVRESAYWETN